ncbi:response regulator [Bacillus nitroreducens]
MNKVLVVDDELIIRTGITKMVEQFSRKQMDVHCASNGMEALAMLEKLDIQLVLTDIRMPKMNGLDLCERIHIQYPHIQVVIISGHDDFNYAKQAMRYGVREYLLKPVLPDDIFAVLDRYFDSQNVNQPVKFSLSEYEAWMELLEEVLWKLEKDRIPIVLGMWDELCKKSGMRPEQLAQLQRESLVNLKKRLVKRSFQAQVDLPKDLEILEIEEMLKLFKTEIMSIVEQLENMRGAKYKNPFEEAKAYIDAHLAEEISLDDIAQRVGMSPTYFSYLFKKESNETFVQYRIRKRMEKAKELMEIPHYRIIDICQDVGYTDYPHFTKTFKKYFGYSPSEYRAKMGIA